MHSFWLALDWAGWVIVLAGLSALQHKCHSNNPSIDDPDEWDPANFPIPGGGPPKGPTAALFPDISCDSDPISATGRLYGAANLERAQYEQDSVRLLVLAREC